MDSPQEFNCIFCKETFQSKEELQIHFRKHGDPNYNQSTKNKTRTNDGPGEKPSEGVEMISCDVCTEMFPTISKAITHKHKFHPDHDTKHFCPWCGKLFTMKHLYNKHIDKSHENENLDQVEGEDFPCDCCDVTFHLSSAMLYHNKFFHRQDTDLPAIGHSKKLKIIQKCSVMIYYCPFCGQEYNNKVNLHKHMTDEHSDENQSPDDVLRCPLCDAIFYHLDAYEHHLSFHSIEDMYNENVEMAESVTEFSLESVPPIMERVENLEPDPKELADDGTMGLDDLLLAMGNTVNEDNPKKSKKHKKHKKSKKEAITLDEFLNMNKDVFGEGIDFQGIEEVPSQIVAKRFKVKKKATPNSGSKMSPKDIEKLRQQGIIIKKQGRPLVKKTIPTKPKQIAYKSDTKVNTSTSDEVLSKLMNQSNNQIKIVRKPTQNISVINSNEDEKPPSPENIEVECDLIQRYTSSETEGEEKSDTKINRVYEEEASDNDLDGKKLSEILNKPKPNTKCSESTPNVQEKELHSDTEDNNENIDLDYKIKSSNSLIALKNVSQHITVKPVISNEKINAISKHEESSIVSNEGLGNLEAVHSETEDPHEKQVKDKPLNALKHLSHLITVKPVIQSNTGKPNSPINSKDAADIEKTESVPMDTDYDDSDDGISDSNVNRQNNQQTETNNKKTTEPKQANVNTLIAFKNVSNKVTIKPMINKLNSPQADMSHSSDEDDQTLNTIVKKSVNNQSTAHQVAVKQQNSVKSPTTSPKVIQGGSRKLPIKESSSPSLEVNTKNQKNIDLLKKLKNVTAKPIGNSRGVQINKCLPSANLKVTPVKHAEKINEDIEIYNIDDSDSDNADNAPPNETVLKTTENQNCDVSSKSTVLQNLSKHLTIKSTFPKPLQLNIKPDPDQEKDLPQDDDIENKHYPEKNVTSKNNKVLQNTLKNLSKHITIKSRNCSPSAVVSANGNKDEHSDNEFDTNNFESDNESDSGRVKITEVDDEHDLSEKDDCFDEDFNDAIVQSPRDSGDEDDANQSQNENFEDLESKIQANTVKRSETKQDDCLKNISKSVTIRSLSEKKAQTNVGTPGITKVPVSLPSNLNKELSIKPFKQGNVEANESEKTKINAQKISNVNKVAGQEIARCTSQSNQKVSMSKNQANTVSKEVTVKTFQTKTVIQEITTTVTKTIKTVNQTTKQEVQTASQSCTQNVVRKVQGMRPQIQQPIKNYQGVVVRHAAPVITGTKVRNAMPSVRPTRPANVSNQLVPVRSATPANVRAPRMPTIRNSCPSTSANNPRPVKMSPNVVSTGINKRPVAPETTGHFSCFKKPKESLIPVSDMSSFNSRENETMTHFSSSTQINKSNTMNMTRTQKGNTVVSSMQMKSEVSSCSQQLDKLNNMAGLRIVKTSQVKQASHEERQVCPAKNNTLEAIQKLQKQGLLVKKPRLEEEITEEGRFSEDDHASDDGFPQDEDFDDDDFS